MAHKKEVIKRYTDNPRLCYAELPFDWKGTPMDQRGRFVNHEHTFINSFRELLKWQLMKNPQKEEKINDTWGLEVLTVDDFLNSPADCIVWLGHASLFIRIAGRSLLIDPVLFNLPLMKRQSMIPVPPDKLSGVDYILVSHDHRDHCDAKSLRLLADINPEATFLTGLGLDRLLGKLIKKQKIEAAGWYQKYLIDERISIYFVPSRHWGRRYLHDTNCNLWGGFVIRGEGKTIYFAGDSGYGSHFGDIGEVFPSIDYFIAGIGAYKPEFFMGQSHTSPLEAVKAFEDTGAKNMIPMHYGTFDLSDEPLGDPVKVLITAGAEIQKRILYLRPGEVEFL
jgi:L-ascorbate metabolism protein UlaG (beta-lactamase superfamily)